jgi:hypothetical protein
VQWTANEIGTFTGKRPKQAALKAANRIYPDISLRERGSKGAYIYRRAKTDKKNPKVAPSWMSAKIWKPNVKKAGKEILESF